MGYSEYPMNTLWKTNITMENHQFQLKHPL